MEDRAVRKPTPPSRKCRHRQSRPTQHHCLPRQGSAHAGHGAVHRLEESGARFDVLAHHRSSRDRGNNPPSDLPASEPLRQRDFAIQWSLDQYRQSTGCRAACPSCKDQSGGGRGQWRRWCVRVRFSRRSAVHRVRRREVRRLPPRPGSPPHAILIPRDFSDEGSRHSTPRWRRIWQAPQNGMQVHRRRARRP